MKFAWLKGENDEIASIYLQSIQAVHFLKRITYYKTHRNGNLKCQTRVFFRFFFKQRDVRRQRPTPPSLAIAGKC